MTDDEQTAHMPDAGVAVADGTRDNGGELASAAAVASLQSLEAQTSQPVNLNVLTEAAGAAALAARLAGRGRNHHALLWFWSIRSWAGPYGDTRAYVLRDGELLRITHDHTYVQWLVDAGRLSPAEAESHPERAILTRALTGRGKQQPDVSVLSVHAGDRYLLCSDGLSAVVAEADLGATLIRAIGPNEAVSDLVELAYAANAPDNIACVVADVIVGGALSQNIGQP